MAGTLELRKKVILLNCGHGKEESFGGYVMTASDVMGRAEGGRRAEADGSSWRGTSWGVDIRCVDEIR